MKADKPKKILILGHPYFVNKLRELRNSFGADSAANYVFTTLPKSKFRKWLSLWHSDLIYLIGGDLRPNRFYHLALRLKKKLVFHWVGTDILEMKAWRGMGRKFSSLLVNKVFHWTEVKWTAAELVELGLISKVVPLSPAVFPGEVKALPEKFVVLTYLPPGKPEFYGERTIVKLAERFPEIIFLAVATPTTNRNTEWPSNLIPVGWVDDMAELYREITLLIRLTQHDGLSFMVLEALANGRHVIWGYPFTGVYQSDGDLNRLIPFLEKLYQMHCRGQLKINQIGREFVVRFYNPKVVWEKICRGMDEVLSG
jgi:hypothetical protein